MPNRFEDAKTIQELVYQTVGAGSVCWENLGGAGVFDSEKAREVATDALNRLGELLNNKPDDSNEVELSMEFTTFIRKPFTVEAVEVTRENIHELSELIGEFGEDESGPFIEADRSKVPTVYRVTPGYWVTKMGSNIRCYSPRVFREQFTEMKPGFDLLLNRIEEG
jgi:hypothetical protein